MEENIREFITRSPGKILLCGGYLILSPRNSGLVVNVDTYFNCKSRVTYVKSTINFKTLLVKIYSANFNLDYIYEINITNSDNNTYLNILNKKNENNNEFIYFSLIFAFYLVINEYNDIFPLTCFIDEINIVLEGDQYFYSFEKGTNSNKKTGLGSSSALIVSLLTNIFLIFVVGNKAGKISGSITNILTEEQMVKVLLFSLIANNYAQKKVGSGFDIQSCLIGSHIFNRCTFIDEFFNFFPTIIDNLTINSHSRGFINNFSSSFLENYFIKISYIQSPNFLRIHLISLLEGSNTRILASKVLEWSKMNQKNEFMDNQIFTEMNIINLEIIRHFSKLDPENNKNLTELRGKNAEIRKKIKQLSEKTEVPIEPNEVSEFLDKIMSISDEVVFGIVPGAGGYDALVVLSYGEITNNKILAFVEEYRKLKNNLIECVEVKFTNQKGTLFEVN